MAEEFDDMPCERHGWAGKTGFGLCPDCKREEEKTASERPLEDDTSTLQQLGSLTVADFQRVMQGYLNSHACMLLFSKLTLYRASGEHPKVEVKRRGTSLRVSLVRTNGEVEHFNRDGKP